MSKRQHGTGAVRLAPDFRDYQARLHPRIVPKMAAIPASASLREYAISKTLDQGATSACVAASTSHMEAIYEAIERKQAITFDWQKLYAENGGQGSNGISTRDVLQDAQDNGVPVVSSDVRYKIKEYAFIDFSAGFDLAIQTIKAAIAAKCPIVLAMLLPDDFQNGMSAGGPTSKVRTDQYHQVMVGEFTLDRLAYWNTWGDWFGQHGWGSVTIDYLRRPEQTGFLYGFTTLDAADEVAPPPPNPTPAPLEFDAVVKAVNDNVVKIKPTTDVLKAGMKIHGKVVG